MRAHSSVFNVRVLLVAVAFTFLLSPVLITQHRDILAVTPAQAGRDFILGRAYLCLQVLSLGLFCGWVSRGSRPYLSAPLLLVVSIFWWHVSFLEGYFPHVAGLSFGHLPIASCDAVFCGHLCADGL